MKIQLSEHFTYSKLLRFTFPSIIMMIFTSIYSVIDGLFVSNFAGKTALAAINIIYPFIMAVGALGFMMGTGGSALVGRLLGEGEKGKANKTFSLIVYTTAIAGILLSALAFLLVPTVSRLFGASGQLLDYCILYGRICFLSMPCFMLQNVFQCFFITAEKPRLGLRRRPVCRHHQHGFRLFVCRCFRTWFKRCCDRNRLRRDYWRTGSYPVFCWKKSQSSTLGTDFF